MTLEIKPGTVLASDFKNVPNPGLHFREIYDVVDGKWVLMTDHTTCWTEPISQVRTRIHLGEYFEHPEAEQWKASGRRFREVRV